MQRLIIKLNLVIDARLQWRYLIVQLLSLNATFEQFFTVFDAPQHLAPVVIDLFVKFHYLLIKFLLVIELVFLELGEVFSDSLVDSRFSSLYIRRILFFL